MVTSIVYTLIGLILCFVLYIAFRAINTGMEAKKANKNLDILSKIKHRIILEQQFEKEQWLIIWIKDYQYQKAAYLDYHPTQSAHDQRDSLLMYHKKYHHPDV